MKNQDTRTRQVQLLPMVELVKSPLESRDQKRFLEVYVTFYDGWNGGSKGYFLHISPITIEQCDGYQMKGFGLAGYGGGGKVRLENAQRYQAKHLDALAAEITAQDVYRKSILAVLGDEKNDTELSPEGVALLPAELQADAEAVLSTLRPARQQKREEKAKQESERAAPILARRLAEAV